MPIPGIISELEYGVSRIDRTAGGVGGGGCKNPTIIRSGRLEGGRRCLRRGYKGPNGICPAVGICSIDAVHRADLPIICGVCFQAAQCSTGCQAVVCPVGTRVGKPIAIFIILFSTAVRIFAADDTVTNESESVQREKLYQRFLKAMREDLSRAPTNTDLSYIPNWDTPSGREVFNQMVVHPSFGYHWDEVPAPTMTGSNAMAYVDSFIAANGWDMQKDGFVFSAVMGPDKSKPIYSLPWKVIHDQKFQAVTYNGILYIWFTGFHHDSSGVAYNPKTNAFSRGIGNFKPIGQHWYVWEKSDPRVSIAQEYERSKN